MRKAERKAQDQPVRLHPNDWCTVEARLLDCSAAGFRAEADIRLTRRAEVTLEVPGIGPVRAFVIWVRGGEFGAEFIEPIPLERAALPAPSEPTKLARLLVQRAAAQRSGLWDHEERLRREISQTLPLQRG